MDTVDLFGVTSRPSHGSVLARTFEYPPFSVLSARDGWWQERKKQWLSLGMRSELGRDAGATFNVGFGDMREREGAAPPEDGVAPGTSIFDPVLAELCCRWFCPPGGVIVDPFAGGSVRGIVAGVLGFEYQGFELRAEQVEANRKQAIEIAPGLPVSWTPGDSRETLSGRDGQADFVFSCPPYGDLEVYSDHPADISAMTPADFLSAYRAIIAAAIATLKENRFACFVVGDYRDKRGFLANFPGATVAAFEDAGARFYNEAVLITVAGSVPMRTGKQFAASRKLGKTHQNILVFCKGDPKKATAAMMAQPIASSEAGAFD